MFFAILCEIFNRIFNTSMILFITNHDVREIIYFIKKHLTFLQKITLFHCSRLMAYPSRSFFINLLFLVHSVIYIDGKSERYKYKVSPLNRFTRIS